MDSGVIYMNKEWVLYVENFAKIESASGNSYLGKRCIS